MKWIANLSNGETVIETKAQAGERMPWQKLLQRCRDEDLTITGLALSVGTLVVEAMPQKMCDGYFHAYEAERVFWRGTIKDKQGIGSVIGDKVYIIWVHLGTLKENGINYSYQEIRPLSEVRIHTTANRGTDGTANKDDSV
jgi:hypothetical protein